jgi:tetratricopeptide (TPR) repeat protein
MLVLPALSTMAKNVMPKRFAFLCVISFFLSTSAFAQTGSVQWQTDPRRHSGKPYISPLRISRTQDVESAFEQCRGSKDLNTKALSCSFVIERSKNRSQVERAYNSRGLANMALKNFSNAVQDFTHAMELDKTNAGYVDNRQGAFFALGQLNRALEDANHAMRLAPSYAFVYHSRAMIYEAMKLYDDAIHDLTTAISLDQNWIELVVDRGKVFAKGGRFDAAISDFNRAIERNGNLTSAVRERGLTYKRMGDKEKARSDLELVLRTEPDDNEIVEALKELQETLTVTPSLPKTPSVEQPTSSASISVPMRMEGGIYVVPVLVNDAITLNFVVDSGAANVNIPADVVLTLMRTRTIKESDFLGEQTYVLADGSKVPSQTFIIRSLKVGNKILENVTCSIGPVQGFLLLGQSFLSRLKSWSVDNAQHTLAIE